MRTTQMICSALTTRIWSYFSVSKQSVILIPSDLPLSSCLIEYFVLLRWKSRHGIPNNAFSELRKTLHQTHTIRGSGNSSEEYIILKTYKAAMHLLRSLTGLQPAYYDCCIHSCFAFTGTLGSQGTIRDRWGSGTWKPQRKYNYSNNSMFSYADTPQMQILKLIIVLRSLSH